MQVKSVVYLLSYIILNRDCSTYAFCSTHFALGQVWFRTLGPSEKEILVTKVNEWNPKLKEFGPARIVHHTCTKHPFA